jgi:hypothetical protein
MKDLAEAAVGLGAADPGPYLDLIGPNDTDIMRTAMLSMSGCGLTVRGLWRRFGMSDPRLEAPYEPASVMTTIQGMAKEAGAWRPAGAGIPELAVGDVVYVSQPDHVGTIVAVSRAGDAAINVTTVDGGSLDAAGRQVVVKWDRTFGYDGSVTAGPMAGGGREVVGTVNLEKMVARFGGGGVSAGGAGRALVAGALALAALAFYRLRRRR